MTSHPAEALLQQAGLDIPPDERDGLVAAYDGIRALCESLHAVRLDDAAPLLLPDDR